MAASAPQGDDSPDGDEPEYEFPVPEFDEEEWERKEIAKAYMSFISFGYGLLLGGAARAVQVSAPGEWWIGFAPVVAGMATLRLVLEQFGYGDHLEGLKSMAGNYFLLFFTAFAMWVLLSNPPFA